MSQEKRECTPCTSGPKSGSQAPEINPQRILEEMRVAGCCCARTRAGGPCQNPAMKNGRCRMHGGASTGPKTAKGLARAQKARVTHGRYGADQREFRAMLREMKAQARRLVEIV